MAAAGPSLVCKQWTGLLGFQVFPLIQHLIYRPIAHGLIELFKITHLNPHFYGFYCIRYCLSYVFL